MKALVLSLFVLIKTVLSDDGRSVEFAGEQKAPTIRSEMFQNGDANIRKYYIQPSVRLQANETLSSEVKADVRSFGRMTLFVKQSITGELDLQADRITTIRGRGLDLDIGFGFKSGSKSSQSELITIDNNHCMDSIGSNYLSQSHFKKRVLTVCNTTITNCLDCDASALSCISCNTSANTYLSANSCPVCPGNTSSTGSSCTCSSGTYKSANNCYNCSYHCNACTSGNSCTSCDLYFTNNGYCNPCVPNCDVCASNSSCTYCDYEYELYANGTNNLCRHCPAGTYQQTTNTCSPCDPICVTCSGGATRCLSCNSSRIFVALTNECFLICGSSEYYNRTTDTCVPCPTGCVKCSVSSNTTIDCEVLAPGWYRNLSGPISTTPFKCGAGFYRSYDESCQPCNITGNFACSRYYGYPIGPPLPSYYYYNGTHQKTCPVQCSNCSLVSGSVSCNYCSSMFASYQGFCIPRFTSGFINSTGSNMVPTVANCLYAFTTTSCEECQGVYQLSLGNLCPGVTCGPWGNGTTSCTAIQVNCRYPNSSTTCSECFDGYYLSGTSCVACSIACRTCTGPSNTQCILCAAGYQPYGDGSCMPQCSPGDYWNVALPSCVSASSNCRTYGSSSVMCTGCSLGFVLDRPTNTCVSICPMGQYWNTTNSVCALCAPTCRTCIDPINCTSCDFNRQLISRQCNLISTSCTANCNKCWTNTTVGCAVAAPGYYLGYLNAVVPYKRLCPNSTYTDPTGNCLPCNASCSLCKGPTTGDCIVCQVGYFRYGVQCTNNPAGCKITLGETIDFANNFTCIPCIANCLLCPITGKCQYCAPGYRIAANGTCETCPGVYCHQSSGLALLCPPGQRMNGSSCIPKCQPYEYLASNGTCVACDISCETCSNITITTCSSCPFGEIRYNTSTGTDRRCTIKKTTSNPAYYRNTTTNTTLRCPMPMKRCTYSTSTFTILECMSGWYFYGNNCIPCDPRCVNCNGSATNCTSCVLGYYLDLVTNICHPICESFEYFDATQNLCLPCNPNCKYCDVASPNGTNCTDCYDGYYLDTGVCKPCHESCQTCTNSLSTSCTTCNQRFVTNGTSCILMCATGTYFDSNKGYCQMCHKYCQECNGPTPLNCTTCITGFTFVANNFTTDNPAVATGSCDRICASDRYPSKIYPNECQPCHITCATCTGPSDMECVTCPTGRFFNQGFCDKCHSYCLTCNGTSQYDCINCQSGFTYEPTVGLCNKVCLIGQALDFRTGACAACNTDCATCIGTTNYSCLTCSTAKPYLLANRACITSCPNHTFYNATSLACESCHSTCGNCFGPLASQCLDCPIAGYFVQPSSGGCAMGCEPHTFQLNTTHCMNCDPTCDTCNGSLINSCLTCMPGLLILPNNTCLSQCPVTFLQVGMSCVPCFKNCRLCSGLSAYECTDCFSDRYLRDDKVCVKICLPGFWYETISDQCYKCDASCKECTAGSPYDCISCAPGLFIHYSGTCVNACPEDTFVNNSNFCAACHTSCKTCKNSTYTDCLTCRGFDVRLLSGACGATCEASQFTTVDKICQACDTSCKECTGPSPNECIDCFNSNYTFLSNSGYCRDCLISPQLDEDTCFMNAIITLLQPGSRSLNINASGTVRLSFRGEVQYTSRLTEDLLNSVFSVIVEPLKPNQYVYKFKIRMGEILIDFYTESSFQGINKVVKIRPNRSIVLTNAQSGRSELIFRNITASYPIELVKAPDASVMAAFSSTANGVNSINGPLSAVGGAMAILSILSSSGLGAPLMKFIKIFKMVSRLRLINIYFGAYMELFLTLCGNMYKIGGDQLDLEAVSSNPNTRGKLDLYSVSVLSAQVVCIPYTIYYLALCLRIYRGRIRKYASDQKKLTVIDYLIDVIAEKGRMLILTMVGIDIVFYSLHSISHINKSSDMSFTGTASMWISFISLVVILSDLMFMIIDNKTTTFPLLRLVMRRDRKLLQKLGGSSSPLENDKKAKAEGEQSDDEEDSPRNNPIGHVEKFDEPKMKRTLIVGKPNEKTHTHSNHPSKDISQITTNINNGKKVELEDLTLEMQIYLVGHKKNKTFIGNPSSEQFFGNGIKLHKLRTFEGRYFNSISLIKIFLFEPFYITMQMFPTAQILSLWIIQLIFTVWIGWAGFKQNIFSSKTFFISTLVNEISLMVFLNIGLIFQMGGGQMQFSDSSRLNLQYFGMIFLGVACLIGIVDFVASIIVTVIQVFKLRKLNKLKAERQKNREERGLVRHRVVAKTHLEESGGVQKEDGVLKESNDDSGVELNVKNHEPASMNPKRNKVQMLVKKKRLSLMRPQIIRKINDKGK